MPDSYEMKKITLEVPFAAEDTEPYIFVSYAHCDRERVFPIIRKLYEMGWNVWYDQGVETDIKNHFGTISGHIRSCAAAVMFVSTTSVTREYVTDTAIAYALDQEKRVVFCELDSAELPDSIRSRTTDRERFPHTAADGLCAVLEGIEGLMRGERRTAEAICVNTLTDCRFALSSPDDEYEGEYTENGGVRLTRYRGSSENVVVPAEWNGQPVAELDRTFDGNKTVKSVAIPYGVTVIGDLVFLGCANLTDLTIPNNVTDIGKAAFCECSGLTSVALPDSVVSIGDRAFADCSNLAAITLPKSLTDIGHFAFYRCTRLTAVTIPGSVTSIGHAPFAGCDKLVSIAVSENSGAYKSVDGVLLSKDGCELLAYPGGRKGGYTIPDGVTSICDWAFASCGSLTAVTIPDSVTTIGRDAFRFCDLLSGLTIPNSVRSIGEGALSFCERLVSVVLPDGITDIGGGLFAGCVRLASLTIPDGVATIGSAAFSGCKSLTEVIIPDGVTAIGEDAFDRCESLVSLSIPDSVTSISEGAIFECSGLVSINVSENNSAYKSVDGVLLSKDGKTLIAYPCGRAGSYSVPDGVALIGQTAFASCAGLTSVTIPDSVTEIGFMAFDSCGSLTSVTIPESVAVIGYQAFSDCGRLTSVIIAGRETRIRFMAFVGCEKLTIFCPEGSLAWDCCDEEGIARKPI